VAVLDKLMRGAVEAIMTTVGSSTVARADGGMCAASSLGRQVLLVEEVAQQAGSDPAAGDHSDRARRWAGRRGMPVAVPCLPG
jgi:hypothetical protein